MKIEKILKKMGITNIEKLDFSVKEDLSRRIAEKIYGKFKNYGIKYEEIYLKLVNTEMYVADIVPGVSKANYIYKNASIYFDRSLDLSVLNEEILREAIYKIQEFRNKRNKIEKLGLCNFDELKLTGSAFNEAAIQYIIYLLLEKKEEKVSAYNLTINSVSTVYPAITNIMRQMAYIAGENYLVQSIINSNTDFKYSFMDKCNEASYAVIMKNTDLMYEARNRIMKMNRDILFNRKIKEEKKNAMRAKIVAFSKAIHASYIKIQKEMCICYFDKEFSKAKTIEKLEELKFKIGEYKALIGISANDSENFFDKYSLDCYYKIERKIEKINKNNELIAVSNSPLAKILRIIRKLFTNPDKSYDEEK